MQCTVYLFIECEHLFSSPFPMFPPFSTDTSILPKSKTCLVEAFHTIWTSGGCQKSNTCIREGLYNIWHVISMQVSPADWNNTKLCTSFHQSIMLNLNSNKNCNQVESRSKVRTKAGPNQDFVLSWYTELWFNAVFGSSSCSFRLLVVVEKLDFIGFLLLNVYILCLVNSEEIH